MAGTVRSIRGGQRRADNLDEPSSLLWSHTKTQTNISNSSHLQTLKRHQSSKHACLSKVSFLGRTDADRDSTQTPQQRTQVGIQPQTKLHPQPLQPASRGLGGYFLSSCVSIITRVAQNLMSDLKSGNENTSTLKNLLNYGQKVLLL